MDPQDRDYSNDEITVHWRASKCIHATICYRELIEVFNPRKRPWVNMEGAPTEQIIDIVKKCPTEALSYDWNDPSRKSDKPGKSLAEEAKKIPAQEAQAVSIKLMKDGPLQVSGKFSITDMDGKIIDSQDPAFLCRCGGSDKKPFCDGSHRKVGLRD